MNNSVPEFAAAELLSLQTRIERGAWVRELHYNERIIFDTFAHYAAICGRAPCGTVDGCTVRIGDTALVLYAPGWQIGRLNYTLAHEVGHILLRHKVQGEREEAQANRFASALLIPPPVLCALRERGIAEAKEVAKFFGVSVSAARIALTRPSVRTPYDEHILRLWNDRLNAITDTGGKRYPLDISADL